MKKYNKSSKNEKTETDRYETSLYQRFKKNALSLVENWPCSFCEKLNHFGGKIVQNVRNFSNEGESAP